MLNPLSDEPYSLWLMMHQTTDAMWAAREKELKQFNEDGLSLIELGALLFIQTIEHATAKKATVTEISRWLFRKHNSVSELLRRMEKRGLVVRNPRQRNTTIKITDRGQQLCRQAMEQTYFVRNLMSSLSEQECQELWRILEKLRNIAFKELEVVQKPPFPEVPHEEKLKRPKICPNEKIR